MADKDLLKLDKAIRSLSEPMPTIDLTRPIYEHVPGGPRKIKRSIRVKNHPEYGGYTTLYWSESEHEYREL